MKAHHDHQLHHPTPLRWQWLLPLLLVGLHYNRASGLPLNTTRMLPSISSAYPSWVYEGGNGTGATCNECQNCMNTTTSYLCGRLRCQCLDSVEYCSLFVDMVEIYQVTVKAVNVSGKTYLGNTTIEGKTIPPRSLSLLFSFFISIAKRLDMVMACTKEA